MAYHKTTTTKVLRTRHRIETYLQAVPDAMVNDLVQVPPNAKLMLVEGPDSNGLIVMEFEEEKAE